MIEPLQFARGVRLAREDELPRPREEALARLACAYITTGFTHRTSSESAYSDYFEINAHAKDIWPLFVALCETLLPAVAAPFVGLQDGEPNLGHYTTRGEAVSVFEPFADRLANDGFIEFGALFSYEGRTEEISVKPHKYLCVWTSEPTRALRVLEKFGVQNIPALQFIDEFPCVIETSADEHPRHNFVIESLVEFFGALAQELPSKVSNMSVDRNP